MLPTQANNRREKLKGQDVTTSVFGVTPKGALSQYVLHHSEQ